eukprot:COSAG02_NODE_1638_length_11542_cov_13.473739_8_plen_49_part_00
MDLNKELQHGLTMEHALRGGENHNGRIKLKATIRGSLATTVTLHGCTR